MRDHLDTVGTYAVLEPDGSLPQDAHDYEALLDAAAPMMAAPEVDENSIAELFYTSGTTGQPKGVALTHRTLHLHALYAMIGIRNTDALVLLHVVPMFHVNGWGTPHTVTATGGTHVMLRKIDPVEIFRLIQTERVTHILGVPTIYNALVNHPDRTRYDLSSLELAVSGGAPASPVLTLASPKSHLTALGPERDRELRSKTGYQIVGVDVRVVDAQGREVPADGRTSGEIIVRSNVVMEGYYKDPKVTAQTIRDGWFHTGDVATIDEEGYVLIVDRAKDLIISGGENISSVEIENTLYAHPAVYECAVLAVPDEQWGEVPKAVVVLKSGRRATEAELIGFCRDRLAHFKAPKSVEFADSLPKGGTGKILKTELREKYWAGHTKRVH